MKLDALKKIQIFCVVFCIAVSSASAYYYQKTEEHNRILEQMEKPTLARKTNTSPAVTTMDQIGRKLKLFPAVYMSSIHFYDALEESGTYIIPGLKATYSLQDGKADMCTTMTPQGICITEHYLLVSAYCHNIKHNSVIYVIDKNSRKFIKEIILPGKPHAGGLAYDTKRKEIWVTSKRAGIPELCVLDEKRIKEYNSKTNKPIKYNYRYSVPTLSNASYLTYENDKIYVGTFAFTEKESRLQIFSLERIRNVKKRDDGRYFILEKTLHTSEKVQGIALDTKYVYFSRSDGPYQNSKLDIYKRNPKKIYESKMYANHNFPERMEQIYLDHDKIYILFESGSNGYNRVGLNFIDRVLVVNRDALIDFR